MGNTDPERRPSRAERFSAVMAALDPGVQIIFRWLLNIATLVAVAHAPEVLSKMWGSYTPYNSYAEHAIDHHQPAAGYVNAL
jgi:hypothetical protein